MDMAFAKDGTLYVLEIDSNSLLQPGDDGAILAVAKNGTKRKLAVPAGALPHPGGITVGDDGLYVTVNSASAGEGKVVRIRARDDAGVAVEARRRRRPSSRRSGDARRRRPGASPASPRSCQASSAIWARPVAPSG